MSPPSSCRKTEGNPSHRRFWNVGPKQRSGLPWMRTRRHGCNTSVGGPSKPRGRGPRECRGRWCARSCPRSELLLRLCSNPPLVRRDAAATGYRNAALRNDLVSALHMFPGCASVHSRFGGVVVSHSLWGFGSSRVDFVLDDCCVDSVVRVR